jgi:hypothetical protein
MCSRLFQQRLPAADQFSRLHARGHWASGAARHACVLSAAAPPCTSTSHGWCGRCPRPWSRGAAGHQSAAAAAIAAAPPQPQPQAGRRAMLEAGRGRPAGSTPGLPTGKPRAKHLCPLCSSLSRRGLPPPVGRCAGARFRAPAALAQLRARCPALEGRAVPGARIYVQQPRLLRYNRHALPAPFYTPCLTHFPHTDARA